MGNSTERPTGTVAFLFTDIENSSRHWATQPDEMSVALARHDDVARSVIEDNGGYIFATGGDGFAVAFARADEAVAASIILQDRLTGSELISVRVGIHVGAAEERDGDYFGPSVNLAERDFLPAENRRALFEEISTAMGRDEVAIPFAEPVLIPDDAPPIDRLVAWSGRDPSR